MKGRPGSRSPWGIAVDAVLGTAVAAMLAFPFVASASVPSRPLQQEAPADRLPPIRRTPAGPVRDVPMLAPGGEAEAAVRRGDMLGDPNVVSEAIGRVADGVLGSLAGPRVVGIANDQNLQVSPPIFGPPSSPYPFHYRPIDSVLDRALGSTLSSEQAAGASDLAGLLMIGAARFPSLFPNAGPVAYSLLDRARAGGSCAPQLNLAFLLSTGINSRDDDTAREFATADADCPGDPTPLYLLAEFQSLRAVVIPEVGQETPTAVRIRRAFDTAHRLERRYPGSSAAWAAEGDAWLRLGYLAQGPKPFTARLRFGRALTRYRRAEALGGGSIYAAGTARALEGLGLDEQAAAAQDRALGAAPGSTPLQVRLVRYLEEAHLFARAADRGARFLQAIELPRGPGLFPSLSGMEPPIIVAEADGPLSLGADQWKPLSVDLENPPSGIGAGGVEDVSFIPVFRPDGLVDVDPWCRDWSRRRDLMLARRPEEALRAIPPAFTDARGGFCGDPGGLLQPVIEMEAGNESTALDLLRRRMRANSKDLSAYAGDADPAAAFLQDLQQNLWRFAGDPGRAAAVADRWIESDPDAPLPYARAGEIAYLRGEFGRAARLFGDAVARAKDPHDLAGALLREGTALEKDRQLDRALPALERADAVASRLARGKEFFQDPQAIYDSYNARAQAGDTELRARRYAAAVPHYEAARRREPQLALITQDTRLIRPEVLENNESLVLVHLGRGERAIEAIGKAVASDPADPVFLENQALVLYRLGRTDEAERVYGHTLRIDPTVFPAANDLGVILAERGDDAGAAVLFRRSVGAEPDYATGWFNLGVVEARMGGSHFLGSQGAFARAFRLDPGLRQRERELLFDEDPFFTTLDLSKPIPPRWHYAASSDRTPVAVAGLVLVLLAVRAGRTIARELVTAKAHEEALEHGEAWTKRLARFGRGVTPVVALVVTVAVVLWPLVHARGASLPDVIGLGAGALVLAGVYLRARARAARIRGVAVRHFTWAPAVPVAVAATALGFGYAPLPAADHEGDARAVRVVPVVALAVLTVVLLVLGRITEVPLTRGLGAAALLMTASVLAPIEPLDGAFVATGRVGLLITLGLLGVALLLALGVL